MARSYTSVAKLPMQKNTPEEEYLLDRIEKYKVGSDVVSYDGKDIEYTILDPAFEPKLPGFVGYPGGKHLLISSEVPEAIKDSILIHEIIEFGELKGQKGRCVTALRQELLGVPDGIRQEYLRYRRDFFKDLIAYSAPSANQEFMEEIQASYQLLLELVGEE